VRREYSVDREYLPVALFRLVELISEVISSRAQITGAEWARERGDVQEYAGGTLSGFHWLSFCSRRIGSNFPASVKNELTMEDK
jgi:hypothetical protein